MSDRTSLAPNCSMREVASGPRLCRSASHPSADHLTICDSPENSSNACCSATTPQSTTSRLQGSDHQSDASVAGRCSSSSNIYMQGRGIRPGFVPEIAIFFGHTGKSTALRSESKACEKTPLPSPTRPSGESPARRAMAYTHRRTEVVNRRGDRSDRNAYLQLQSRTSGLGAWHAVTNRADCPPLTSPLWATKIEPCRRSP
jgi:hypothetical protein